MENQAEPLAMKAPGQAPYMYRHRGKVDTRLNSPVTSITGVFTISPIRAQDPLNAPFSQEIFSDQAFPVFLHFFRCFEFLLIH